MEVGIVGLPNVGKSTLFNALTAASALAANYPFATIEPNIGIVPIPDPRLTTIKTHIKSEKIIHATLRLVDIAGIVRGASQGEGLGNKFLSHIRQVDAIAHVVRCFENVPGSDDIAHVEGSVDPMRDIETIETELILADLQTIENALPKAVRAAKGKDHDAILRVELLEKLGPMLDQGKPARLLEVEGKDQQRALAMLGLITTKRVLYAMNVDENDVLGEGPMCQIVRNHAASEGMQAVAVCAKIESELSELEGEDKLEMLEALELEEPALDKLARSIYTLLGLQSFYTAGPKEIRAWPIPIGTKAPQAAGTIHTDFERGFIRVEAYLIDDLVEHGSERAIKDAGKMRTEGKEYVMHDADVCNFLFNV